MIFFYKIKCGQLNIYAGFFTENEYTCTLHGFVDAFQYTWQQHGDNNVVHSGSILYACLAFYTGRRGADSEESKR